VFYNLVPPLDHPALALQVAWPVQVFVSNLVAQVGAWGMILFAALVCCTLPLFRMLSDKQQRWGMCIGATGVLIAIAYVIKHVFLHEWYAPLFCIPILAFAFSVAQRNILARALAVILSLLPVATIAEYSLATVEKPSILRAARPGARVQRYMQVGALLHKLFPDARLMTSEIGGLGISFRGTILDGAGLITPAALRYHPLPGATSGVGGIPAGLIREMKPELIVSYPVFLLDTRNTDAMQDYIRLSMPAFSRKYQQLLGASDLWGSDTLLVFVRRDIADQKKIDILKRKLHAAEDSGH
jgi:hypothetical protein